jgi:hypothetical protein
VERHDTHVNDTHAQDKCPTYIYQMIELSIAIYNNNNNNNNNNNLFHIPEMHQSGYRTCH